MDMDEIPDLMKKFMILTELNFWITIFHLKAFAQNAGRRQRWNNMDRKAMYRLSYGLFVLTAREAEKIMDALLTQRFRQLRNQTN